MLEQTCLNVILVYFARCKELEKLAKKTDSKITSVYLCCKKYLLSVASRQLQSCNEYI